MEKNVGYEYNSVGSGIIEIARSRGRFERVGLVLKFRSMVEGFFLFVIVMVVVIILFV